MKKIVFIAFLVTSLFAIEKPISQYIANGGVTDILYENEKLYASTSNGFIHIFDTTNSKLLQSIELEKITDFMGDLIESKIYSIDLFENKMLILSQAKKGARRIHLYEDKKLKLIIPYTKKLYMAKAKFLNSNTIIFALLGSELISYDTQKLCINYQVQVSQSKFSDFCLTQDKTKIIVADESGELQIFSTKDGVRIKTLSGQNLDNVFEVNTHNNKIITAGQDRRTVVYNENDNSTYYKKSSFLIYSAGLSPSAKLGAYSSDENNNVTVFNTRTKQEVGIFGFNKMTLTNILFIDEHNFFVSSDSKTINKYKIK